MWVIGGTEGTNWIINKGLKNGDKVIVEGLQRVRPGALVQYNLGGRKACSRSGPSREIIDRG